MPDNKEFLQALFAEDAPYVHVTDFPEDPANLPADRHLSAWRGDWFCRRQIGEGTNQYFTISIFNPDDKGVARRRKALFLRTRVIVLDDVREKLAIEAVNLLPRPAYILETSPGSEQWGYILDVPCSDRGRVENLLDGLVANGLAPNGKDPGMKGVTRYVRLPDGYNTKQSKLVNGQPYKCRLLEWHPERRVSLEELAEPFTVNLDMPRREARVDGATNVPDHPLLQIPDIIRIKEVRSDGRFDITCPWVDEHTDAADDGAAIFTNEDGTIGFKCHHGSCEKRTARDLVRWVDEQAPGFGEQLSIWRLRRDFADVTVEPTQPAQPEASATTSFDSVDGLITALRRLGHTTKEARDLSARLLREIENQPAIDRINYHKEICDIMHWRVGEFATILKDLRAEWYSAGDKPVEFLAYMLYVSEQNQVYDSRSQMFLSIEAFYNTYAHLNSDIRNEALVGGAIEKVDRLDFAPRMPIIFTKNGVRYGNTWREGVTISGKSGDCNGWLAHWDAMGWGEYRDHHLKWMAHTLRFPEIKVNHGLILGGMEGTGKDFLLFPLIHAMQEYSVTVEGTELLRDHNEYLMRVKHLHINETELGDHRQGIEVSNRLKPMAAAPPMTLRVNQKHITPVKITNLVSVSMTTNSRMPLRLNGPSRRFYATWTDLQVRDRQYQMKPEWAEYWTKMWSWMMHGGGVEACIDYLLNRVDLSEFNPGVAPPMTDYLRNIVDSSKSPWTTTMESLIENRVGVFQSDLVTAAEVVATVRIAVETHNEMIAGEVSKFNVSIAGRALADVADCIQLRARGREGNHRVWAVRDSDKYRCMTESKVLEVYLDQKRMRTERPSLSVVGA